jgi:hypothetical protein
MLYGVTKDERYLRAVTEAMARFGALRAATRTGHDALRVCRAGVDHGGYVLQCVAEYYRSMIRDNRGRPPR